jgi:two-component system, HptB-dependent secretion and biofilm response regulator
MNKSDDKLKILAVDDNRTNLHILQVFLKKQGHEVILGENGEDAVRLFQSESPDIVLLDIMMPVMNGFDAARKIKSLCVDRWVPLVFLSALNRDENLIEGLDCGADDYLTKPINFVVLEAKLRTMQRSLRMQQLASDALRRVQAISDNVLDAIVTIDTQGKILSVNRSTEHLFGWPANELTGRNINVLMPNPHHDRHDQYIRDYLETGRASAIGKQRELEAINRQGKRFPVSIGISEVTLDGQRIFIGVIRDISESKLAEQKLREGARLLQAYYDQTQSEQQLAMRLMEKQLHRPGLKDESLHYKVIPAENFSGDAVAATRSTAGRFYALLADATGHGLTAAISVLPVLAVFYRLAGRDRPLMEIVLELNLQLKESMPIGRFVAATVLCLDPHTRQGEIWVGGTPDAHLFDRWGRLHRTFSSDNLALGILNNKELAPTGVAFDWTPESQVVLFSDGLIEAENPAGEQFGGEGLAAAIANTSPATRFKSIETALSSHLAGNLASDDISIMLIDCP